MQTSAMYPVRVKKFQYCLEQTRRSNVAQNGITVELSDRIILNPYAAKRLAHILTGVIQQYETAFGPLPID